MRIKRASLINHESTGGKVRGKVFNTVAIAFILGIMAIPGIVLVAERVDHFTYPGRREKTRLRMSEYVVLIDKVRTQSGQLPTGIGEIEKISGSGRAVDAWGGAIDYEVYKTNCYRLEAVSPYPHWDIFSYDSAKPAVGIAIYPF